MSLTVDIDVAPLLTYTRKNNFEFINIHHAVAEGFHVSRFFNEVQELINSLTQ